MTTTKAVVLFDGDCAFCTKGVQFLGKLDWLDRLSFQSLRDPQAWPATGPDVKLNSEAMVEAMHLLTADRNAVYVGFSAFRRISWMLPLTMMLAPFLYLPGVLPLGNRMYRWVARNRFNLVPCFNGACAVPKASAALSVASAKSD